MRPPFFFTFKKRQAKIRRKWKRKYFPFQNSGTAVVIVSYSSVSPRGNGIAMGTREREKCWSLFRLYANSTLNLIRSSLGCFISEVQETWTVFIWVGDGRINPFLWVWFPFDPHPSAPSLPPYLWPCVEKQRLFGITAPVHTVAKTLNWTFWMPSSNPERQGSMASTAPTAKRGDNWTGPLWRTDGGAGDVNNTKSDTNGYLIRLFVQALF